MANRKPKGKRKSIIMKKVNALKKKAVQAKKHLPCESCDYVLTNSQELDVLSVSIN